MAWRRTVELHLFGDRLGAIYRRLAISASLVRLASLIEARHVDPGLSLGAASQECGIERNHLNVRLRRATGLTFHRLLTRRRLLRAADLLNATDRDLLAIALDSGFGSLSSFERNFARAFGMAPSRYRELLRKTQLQPSLPADRGRAAAPLPLFPDFRRVFPD